jgi:hypothetical protein
MQRDFSSTHKCSSAWKSHLPQDKEIWKQISTAAPAPHPLPSVSHKQANEEDEEIQNLELRKRLRMEI